MSFGLQTFLGPARKNRLWILDGCGYRCRFWFGCCFCLARISLSITLQKRDEETADVYDDEKDDEKNDEEKKGNGRQASLQELRDALPEGHPKEREKVCVLSTMK